MIVEPLLWLAVACLLIAFFGVLRENIRLKAKMFDLECAFDAQQLVLLAYVTTENEKPVTGVTQSEPV